MLSVVNPHRRGPPIGGVRNGCKASIDSPEKRSFPAPPPVERKGPGNSDGVIRDNLASPKPPDGGEPEEHGNEEYETESRGGIQGLGGSFALSLRSLKRSINPYR